MEKNKSAQRAWNLIRLAFLWARKRRVLRRRLLRQIRLFPKFIKSLTLNHSNRSKAITYREHQFSFETSPFIDFKKLSPSSMRFKFPCLRRARVDFEYDFVDISNDFDEARKSFLKDEYEDDDDECEIFEEAIKCDDEMEDEEEIDAKAEHFIARFYEQMKLQKQLSYARYNEMLNRGISCNVLGIFVNNGLRIYEFSEQVTVIVKDTATTIKDKIKHVEVNIKRSFGNQISIVTRSCL